MTIVLALITSIAALAALRFPEQYMAPGPARVVAQVVAVLLSLFLGNKVASFGPPPPGPLNFMQVVVVGILVLGVVMRLALKTKSKKE